MIVTPRREELLADIVNGAKSVIEHFDIAMASQSNSGADARLTALANYGEAGLELLRTLVRLAAKPADEPDPDAMNAKHIAEDTKLAANVREATIAELAKLADEVRLLLTNLTGFVASSRQHEIDQEMRDEILNKIMAIKVALSTTGEPKR